MTLAGVAEGADAQVSALVDMLQGPLYCDSCSIGHLPETALIPAFLAIAIPPWTLAVCTAAVVPLWLPLLWGLAVWPAATPAITTPTVVVRAL